MQYSESEQQYLLLRSQFNNELATIHANIEELNAQIEDLVCRKQHIEELLAVTDVDVDVEFQPDEIEGLRVIDEDLVAFLDDHPGSRRAEINTGLEPQGWTPSEVEKALTRCKNAGLIVREGKARASVWFSKEVS